MSAISPISAIAVFGNVPVQCRLVCATAFQIFLHFCYLEIGMDQKVHQIKIKSNLYYTRRITPKRLVGPISAT